MKSLSPIILFVYNRPDHTSKTLEALANNILADQSKLFIFADGPKLNANEENLKNIDEVRKIIREKQWCAHVEIIESPVNKGLADSIVSGVTEIIGKYGKVIVLEDDIVTSPGFLKYMNEALSLYENEDRVMQISGYMYPAKFKTIQSTFFLNILSCWGWATWKRAWDKLNLNVDDHIHFLENNNKVKHFNLEGFGDYYYQLEANKKGIIKTWAVKWFASCYRNNGLTLFPKISLSNNIGFDNSGSNCGNQNIFNSSLINEIEVQSIKIKEDKKIRKQVIQFYKPLFKKDSKPFFLLKKIISLMRKGLEKALILINPKFRTYLENEYQFKELLSYKSNNVILGKHVTVYPSYKIAFTEIGDYTYITPNSTITNTSIGKFCSIGPNFFCGWGIHPTNGISTHPMFYSSMKQNGISLSKENKVVERQKIIIGNDVLIGANVVIIDGIKIGNGAVIGAGCIVSKDVPAYAIVVGNPMKIVRYRFSDEKIEALQKINWWDFNDEYLNDIEKYFFDIDGFLTKNEERWKE